MWNQITEKLVSLVSSVSEVATVYDYEATQFNSSPVAVITPADSESAYHTTNENRRIYAFTVRLLVLREAQQSQKTVDAALRDLVDRVINVLDINYTLSGTTVPTGYQLLFMRSAPSAWGYLERENIFRTADISIQVVVDVDVNLIS